jgi:hypothetical protein
MNWDAIGAVGEVAGAVAVTVTLVFLVIQIRHSARATERNNSLSQASALDQGFDQFSNFRRMLSSDRELTDLWLRGREGKELDDVDEHRFGQLVVEWTLILRNNYIRNETVGNEDIPDMMVELLIQDLLRHPGFREMWFRTQGAASDPTGFADVVRSTLNKREGT